MQNSCSYKSP